MKKKLFGLFGIAAAILSVAAMATTIPLKQAGPFFIANTPFDSATIGAMGGLVKTYIVASADTEKIGNIVYVSGKNFVNHSATLANYNALAGIVVGGQSTNMQPSVAIADTSTIAALPGKRVLVLERGRFCVLFDTGAGLSPGTGLVPSAKSGMGGRAATRTTAIDTFFRTIGKTIDTAVSGKCVLTDIRIK